MKQQKVIFLLLVVTVILTIALSTGVGYAVATDNNVKIYDEAMSPAAYGDFRVKFTGKPKSIGDGIVDAKITGQTTAIMHITGLKSVGDTAVILFDITNNSRDMAALLSNRIVNSNTKYFEVTTKLSNKRLSPKNGKTTLEIAIKLIKTPINNIEVANILIEVIAKPGYAECF